MAEQCAVLDGFESHWLIPPACGYFAADLDTIPGLPRHTELIDGSLVVSPDSCVRDRVRKPLLYAEAGFRVFWRMESENGRPVVYSYELDPATKTYVPTGIHRGRLIASWPFPIDIDLDAIELPGQ